jgi:hypothetical protein
MKQKMERFKKSFEDNKAGYIALFGGIVIVATGATSIVLLKKNAKLNKDLNTALEGYMLLANEFAITNDYGNVENFLNSFEKAK